MLALDGDSAAYEAALTLIAQRLRGFFSRRLQSMPSEVEDLVQETLMAIHVKRATYDAHYAVTSWVLAIGKYKLVDFWRRHERTDGLHDDIEQTDSSELMPWILLLVMMVIGFFYVMSVPQALRKQMIFGQTWLACLWFVPDVLRQPTLR